MNINYQKMATLYTGTTLKPGTARSGKIFKYDLRFVCFVFIYIMKLCRLYVGISKINTKDIQQNIFQRCNIVLIYI